jgi:hypothetical protein
MPLLRSIGRVRPPLSDALDHKLESAVRYPGIEVEDALELAERTEV